MSQASHASEKGAASVAARPADALPEGARLGEFEVGQVLGAGGFGIVYQAWDHALEREVALKEYLPVTLAGRGPGYRVTIRARSHEESFALGLRSFVNEARLLARFDHPSLLKVYRFWEDHGTAYMAMPLYHGRTLREVRQAMAPGSPGEVWARTLLEPMLGALETLHGEGVYHRDIAPDNILMTDEGRPVLLDFGAARRVIGDHTHALTAILKPHFAPIEQYADVSSVRQGPWTDLYGLAATVYYLLVGQPPLPAAARAIHDELVPLARLQPANCSQTFLQAIDWAMAVRPAERPQSVAIWRDALEGRMDPPRCLRGDITAPGVTARSVAAARVMQTDFDPTRPLGPKDGPAPVWPASRPEAVVPEPAVASGVVPVAYPLAAVPALRPRLSVPALPKRWWVWGGAGGMLALMVAFVGLVSSRTPPALDGESPALAAGAGLRASAPAMAAATPDPAGPARGPAWAASGAVVQAVQPRAPEPGARPAPRLAPADRAGGADARRPAREMRSRFAVQSASARCEDRNFLSRLICLKHECERDARLRNDPACVAMRREEEERRQALANH